MNGEAASAISNDDVYSLVMWIAADNPELDATVEQLRRLLTGTGG